MKPPFRGYFRCEVYTINDHISNISSVFLPKFSRPPLQETPETIFAGREDALSVWENSHYTFR